MSGYVRVRRSVFQTPIRHFTHPDSGRRVSVVGMMHVGEERYFREIGDLVTGWEHSGAVVWSEGSKDDADTGPVGEAMAVELDRCAALTRRRLREWGWANQIDALAPGNSWREVDVPTADVVDLGGDALLRRVRAMNARLDWPAGDRRRPHLFQAQTSLGLRMAAADRGVLARWRRRATDPVLLHRRHGYVFEQFDQATFEHLVLIWGARHLLGFAAGLRERGYTPNGQTWHSTCRLPPIGRSVARAILALPPRPLRPLATRTR